MDRREGNAGRTRSRDNETFGGAETECTHTCTSKLTFHVPCTPVHSAGCNMHVIAFDYLAALTDMNPPILLV